MVVESDDGDDESVEEDIPDNAEMSIRLRRLIIGDECQGFEHIDEFQKLCIIIISNIKIDAKIHLRLLQALKSLVLMMNVLCIAYLVIFTCTIVLEVIQP